MNKIEQEKYVEMMEMKTNKASQDIIRMVKDQGLDPQAAIVSILKASAIIMESYSHIGGDADSLEAMVKETIGPAREEARRLIKRSGMPKSFDNQCN